VIDTGRRRRRTHSPLFKAEAVGACQQPSLSIAAVALTRGLNANLLRLWVRQAERSGVPIAIRSTAPSVAIESTESFVLVTLPSSPTESTIRIEVRRKGRSVSIDWPASAAREVSVFGEARAHHATSSSTNVPT
jgi:transposase-like protein